jgi:hypothetical protein
LGAYMSTRTFDPMHTIQTKGNAMTVALPFEVWTVLLLRPKDLSNSISSGFDRLLIVVVIIRVSGHADIAGE